jgi:hypothetical protein
MLGQLWHFHSEQLFLPLVFQHFFCINIVHFLVEVLFHLFIQLLLLQLFESHPFLSMLVQSILSSDSHFLQCLLNLLPPFLTLCFSVLLNEFRLLLLMLFLFCFYQFRFLN